MPNLKSNVALNNERPQAVPLWLIALLTLLICGALWLLFPKTDLERRLATSQDESELSINYLINLLRSDPNNESLQALLKAKQLRQMEIKRAAEEASRQALPTAVEALWKQWQSLYSDYQEAEKLSAKSTHQIDQLRPAVMQALRAIPRQDLSQEQMLYLASSSLVLRDTPFALELYEELAQHTADGAQRSQIYAEASRQLLGFSQYEDASRLLQKASVSAESTPQTREYLLNAIQVLQAANRSKDALALAEANLETLGDEPFILKKIVELARAAGQPATAEKYVKKLLKLSLLEQWHAAQAQVADAGNASASFDDGAWSLKLPMQPSNGWSMQQTATNAVPKKTKEPVLPFDEQTYKLAYDVFLENRNLEDALRTAQAAVKQSPQNMVWRERLAHVAEWSGRSQLALDNWLFIAQGTKREDAWKAVMRMAPGLFDDHALTAGILHLLHQRPNDPALLRSLVESYERQGTPQKAIDYLLHHGKSPEALVMLARVAERDGQTRLALDTWKRVFEIPEQRTPAHAMAAASMALLEGQPDLGLRWLVESQAYIHQPMPDEGDYWRFMGSLAQRQRDDQVAAQAFRKLLQTPDASISDYDGIINILLRSNREEAAQLSLQAWEKFHSLRHLTQAFYLLEEAGDPGRLGSYLKKVMSSPDLSERLLNQPSFLHVLGMYYERTKQFDKAQAAFSKGLALTPESLQLRQSLLWLLIDSQDSLALSNLLARVESNWAQDLEMHDALSAANQNLSRPAVALQRYLQPQLQRKQEDFLWMMSYADALEQNQQADLAWRLRRELWLKQQAKEPKGKRSAQEWLTPQALDKVQRQARIRLTLNRAYGDDEMALMRELMRQDLQTSGRNEYSPEAKELALAWLQDKGEYSAERGYLWQQYARSRGKKGNAPLWAQITIAIAEKDTAQASQLLDRYGDRLPRHDYLTAAVMAGDVRLAQTAGFDGLSNQPDDDTLHTALTEQLLAMSHFSDYGFSQRQLSGIDEAEHKLRWHRPINSRWALELEADHTRRTINNFSFVSRPSSEHGAGLRLRRLSPKASTELMLGERRSLGTYHPVQLSHSLLFDNRWTLDASIGKELSMQDTLAMRMGGMKDRLALGATYQFSRQDRLGLEVAGERYSVQTGGSRIGSGQHATLQYTHSYRSETPSLEFGVFTSWHRYSRTDPASLSGPQLDIFRYLPAGSSAGSDYLLPGNFRFSGIQVSTDTRYAQDYTRRWRPFASLALTHHSLNGAGYEARMGFSGSLLGPDHWMVGFNLSKTGLNNTGTSRELQLTYRLHY